MKRIVILGAGLSGLATAFRLLPHQDQCSIQVFEARTRPGGNIWTDSDQGYICEAGPNGFLDSKPSTMQLCRDLGIANRLIPGSDAARKNRYLYLNHELVCLPGDPLGILRTPVLSWRGKLAMLAEPFRRRPGNAPQDESISEFGNRRFGKEATQVFLDALVTGIHAGDPEQLSLQSAFPRLALFEKQYGGILRGFLAAAKLKKQAAIAKGEKPQPQRMWSFPEGLRVLIEALATAIGPSLRLSQKVQSITRDHDVWQIHCESGEVVPADVIIDTTPAHQQAHHWQHVDAEMAAELAEIRYNAIAVVLLGYRQADASKQPDGFGYIAPQHTQRDVLGVQWCSSIFPNRAPTGHVLWRALCGGVKRAELATLPDAELLQVVQQEMQTVMGVTGQPVFTRIIRWPKAIPQYFVGHRQRLERIGCRLKDHPGVFLSGNAYHGVAMNDCTEQAEVLAKEIFSLPELSQ